MKKIALILLLIIYSTSSFAQNVRKRINIKEFIYLAKQNDPDFQKISHDKRRLEFFIDQNSPYRPAIFTHEHEYGVDSKNDLETSNFSTSISKEFVDTGTNLSVGRSGSDRSDREEEVTEFSIEQSLYKNLFGKSSKLRKSAIKSEEYIITLQLLESYEDYIGYIIAQYLDFQKLYLDKILSEKIYQEALKLQKNVLSKKKKNIATSIDLDRANLQVLLREEDMINKRKDFMSKWTIIKKITGQDEIIIPEINMNELLDKTFPESSIDKLRVYKIIGLQEDIAKKELKLSDYDNMPSLKLVAGYRMDESKRYSTSVDSNELLAGIKFQMPLGNLVGKANNKSAAFNLNAIRIGKKSLFSELSRNLSDLQSQLQELRKKEIVSKNKVKIMERILKDEENKYQYGKIDLDQLINTKNSFISYRFGHQSDLLNINTKIIEFLSLTDQLLELENQLNKFSL
jgi:outer membrane protein TolC